jgi:AcrR family transcriptional regulator
LSAPEPESRQRLRFPGVRAPKPLLPPETERRLTRRQRQVLDALEELVIERGLAELTMAQIAARVSCSLRTLYGISPSKDELVLTVVDRRLHRIGRAAIESLDASMSPLEAVQVYLMAANAAVQPTAGAFLRDFAGFPGAKRLADAHAAYVVGVTQSLLDRALAEAQIRPVDTAAVAHVLAGLAREFARAEVSPAIASSPKETADAITAIILRGLRRS